MRNKLTPVIIRKSKADGRMMVIFPDLEDMGKCKVGKERWTFNVFEDFEDYKKLLASSIPATRHEAKAILDHYQNNGIAYRIQSKKAAKRKK